MRSTIAALVAAAALLVAGPPKAIAQSIRVEGGEGERAVRLLQTVATRGDYLFLERDTTLSADTHVAGDLVIWDAEVRLEGRVDGDVVVLGGTLHVRPAARIAGRMVTIRGLALASRHATAGALVDLTPGRAVLFARREEELVVTIVPPPRTALVGLPGIAGLRHLTYDRVDGLAISIGPQLRLTRREDGPTLDAWATARSARGRLGGGSTLTVPLPADFEIAARLERATLTPDAWIRGAISNSLVAIAGGEDVRDYHESDRAAVMFRRRIRGAVPAGGVWVEPYLTLSVFRDRSLGTQAPWSLLGQRLERPNPAVTDTLFRSAELGSRIRWQGSASALSLLAGIEHAPANLNDVDFSSGSADLYYQTRGLWRDQFEIRTHLRGTFGDDPAPPQRWTHLGGPGTLPTLPIAAVRGDQLVFLEATYSFPLAFAELPLVGVPALRATFATGTAWMSGTEMPPWEQNVGVGFELSLLVVQAFVDPHRSRPRPTLSVGLQLP